MRLVFAFLVLCFSVAPVWADPGYDLYLELSAIDPLSSDLEEQAREVMETVYFDRHAPQMCDLPGLLSLQQLESLPEPVLWVFIRATLDSPRFALEGEMFRIERELQGFLARRVWHDRLMAAHLLRRANTVLEIQEKTRQLWTNPPRNFTGHTVLGGFGLATFGAASLALSTHALQTESPTMGMTMGAVGAASLFASMGAFVLAAAGNLYSQRLFSRSLHAKAVYELNRLHQLAHAQQAMIPPEIQDRVQEALESTVPTLREVVFDPAAPVAEMAAVRVALGRGAAPQVRRGAEETVVLLPKSELLEFRTIRPEGVLESVDRRLRDYVWLRFPEFDPDLFTIVHRALPEQIGIGMGNIEVWRAPYQPAGGTLLGTLPAGAGDKEIRALVRKYPPPLDREAGCVARILAWVGITPRKDLDFSAR